LVRSTDPTHSDSASSQSSEPFAAQLALAKVHPELAPLCKVPGGYALDVRVAHGWFALPPARGFAGYGLARALRMLLDVLKGLAALHDTPAESGAGFVHGELAPSLIRVDARGVARLLPLAPWHWQANELPMARESLGHLAPERLLGDAVERRADVFSAGVLLWEALAGCRLFEHDSVDGIVTRLMGGKVLLPELPPELAWAIPLKAVAMRALAVDPEQRFADCAKLAVAIEAVARGRVASHAEVAAFFRAPAHSLSVASAAPFRSSHKSSLSALVTATVPLASPAPEIGVAMVSRPGRARRAAWTVTALVSLFAALGVGALTRYNHVRAAAHQAPLSAPMAPVPVPLLTAPTLAAPLETGTTAANEPAPSAPALATDGPSVTPAIDGRLGARAVPTARDAKGHAVNKFARPPAPAKPAVPAKTHPRDAEADQYGI
jgi:eukaryotic-like serine/threonine-protein kinase